MLGQAKLLLSLRAHLILTPNGGLLQSAEGFLIKRLRCWERLKGDWQVPAHHRSEPFHVPALCLLWNKWYLRAKRKGARKIISLFTWWEEPARRRDAFQLVLKSKHRQSIMCELSSHENVLKCIFNCFSEEKGLEGTCLLGPILKRHFNHFAAAQRGGSWVPSHSAGSRQPALSPR